MPHHPPDIPRIRRLTAAVAALAATASLAAATTGAQAAGSAPLGAATPVAEAASNRVTLVTGDTVAVTTAPDGRRSVALVAEEGTDRDFRTVTTPDGELYVYPSDALPGIASGALDEQLFNVTRLIADGYADASTAELPVIVSYRDKPSAATLNERTRRLPAVDRARDLPRLGMAGVDVEKSTAEKFWQAVRPRTTGARDGVATTSPGPAGVGKLWYNGRVRVALDQSVPQVGAPTAWAAGYDGTGVTVAVLDTGADLNHPDIAPRITSSKSFVVDEAVQDGHGHGTHVASTVAGSGAGSGGRMKGVAPGADLVVGKVLDNTGSGDDFQILAGMEWAAAEQRADVISMSLGGTANPGGDAKTEAVERLSASTGALFVIAAGNSGPGPGTVKSPAMAASALTVGAVEKSGALAFFSSRGPRLGDDLIKPEITAPGVNIVAARAAGTTMGTPVDALYTKANGTSMATPHVSGAAALLAQIHPDWSGQRIKAELVATAKKADGYHVYEQGNGRLDITAALGQKLKLSGFADFGLIGYSDSGYAEVTRSITLTNDTDRAATVALDIAMKTTDGTQQLPAGALRLEGAGITDGRVTVPAHGTAVVDAVLDPNLVPAGLYSGYLTATADDGATAHTAFGISMEGEHHYLTVDLKDRKGRPASLAQATVQSTDGNYFSTRSVVGGKLRLRLAAGTYTVTGTVDTAGGGNASVTYASDMFSLPDLDLTEQDVSTTVDGTTATDFALTVPDEKRPLEPSSIAVQATRASTTGDSRASTGMVALTGWSDKHFGAVPSGGGGSGEFRTESFLTMREPLVGVSVAGPHGFAVKARTSRYAERFEGTRTLPLVDVGAGTAAELAAADIAGKAVLVHVPKTDTALATVLRAAERAGAAAAIAMPEDDSPQGMSISGVTMPYVATGRADGLRLTARLARQPVTVSFTGVKESRYTYSAAFSDRDAFPADMTRSAARERFATVTNAFHSDRIGHLTREFVNSWGPSALDSVRAAQSLYAGGSRQDHLLAADGTAYQQVVYQSQSSALRMTGPARSYRPEQRLRTDWFAPVGRPSPAGTGCDFCRTDQSLLLAPGTGGDSDPSHTVAGVPAGTTTYYRDGEQVTDPARLLVPERADYRVVYETARPQDLPGVTLAGRTRTEWSFGSARPTAPAFPACTAVAPKATTCETLPVLLLDYRVKTDLLNQVPADAPYTIGVDVSRPVGRSGDPSATGATVSVSYDDGATWQPAKVVRQDADTFLAHVRHPAQAATNGYVTLRTEVWDEAGSRTVQTVTRAYALK